MVSEPGRIGTLQKIMAGFSATSIFQKFKVALNPLPQFFKLCKKLNIEVLILIKAKIKGCFQQVNYHYHSSW